jgi:GH18 family chitinase
MRQGGAKVLISVGGAAVPYATYLNIARDEKAKTIFFQKLIDIARQKELDGVDLNFEEWSNQITVADRDLVNQLGVDLAREMKATNPDWLISITLPTAYWLEMGFGCDQVNSKLIDLAHHLSYDYAELGSDKPNAPFRNPQEEIVPFGQSAAIEKSIYGSLQYYAGQGCQMSKIAGGIPFYTSRQQKWEEVSRQRNWVKTELNQLYLEKMGIRNNLQYFVDDPEAIARKVQMFKEMGLGGVVVWEVGQEGPAGDLSMAVGGGDS